MTRESRPLVFLGTPHAAAVILEQLIADGFHIAHVVTRPDAKRGRGGAVSASPVKEVALRHGVPVSHDLEWLKANNATPMLGIVVAYGRIIPTAVLEKTPMINVHFSLLPRWRGAAPVERAILAGDHETGVCIMEVEPTLDTGAVYSSSIVPIDDTVTAQELTQQLAQVGAELLVRTLNAGLGEPIPQGGEATYAEKISPDELRIDWSHSPERIVRGIRCFRSYTMLGGARLRIVEATPHHQLLQEGELSPDGFIGAHQGSLRLIRVQPEGKQVMDAQAWLRGRSPDAPTICD